MWNQNDTAMPINNFYNNSPNAPWWHNMMKIRMVIDLIPDVSPEIILIANVLNAQMWELKNDIKKKKRGSFKLVMCAVDLLDKDKNVGSIGWTIALP